MVEDGVSIEDLHLSVRSRLHLLRAGLTTVGQVRDLIKTHPAGLMAVKGIGPVCEHEILRRIEARVPLPNEKKLMEAGLRDYFAGQAMVGIVSALHGGIRPADIQAMAADCYGLADAMLAERAKGAAK